MMRKTTLALAALGALAASHAKATDTPAPTVSPATETPDFLKQDKPAAAAATPAPSSSVSVLFVSSVVNPLLSSTLCRAAFRGACHIFM